MKLTILSVVPMCAAGLCCNQAEKPNFAFANGGLWTADATRPDHKKLVLDEKLVFAPAISPDGTRIAFVHYVEGSFATQIGICRSDGTDRRQLTRNQARTFVSSPTWSSDGLLIAYEEQRIDTELENRRGGTRTWPDVVVMSITGRAVARISDARQPAFAPNSPRLLYRKSQGLCCSTSKSGFKNETFLLAATTVGGLAWVDERRISYWGRVFTPKSEAGPYEYILVIYDVAEGTKKRLAVIRRLDVYGCQVLKDGRTYLFTVFERQGLGVPMDPSVYALDLEGSSKPRVLMKGVSTGIDSSGLAHLILLSSGSRVKRPVLSSVIGTSLEQV